MTPSDPKNAKPAYMTDMYLKPRKQMTVINLDDFSDVTIRKTGDFSPLMGHDILHQLQAKVNGNMDLLTRIINDGLRAQVMRELGETAGEWKTVDEDNKEVGEFVGTPANSKIVNQAVLTLAKTVFGYSDVDTPEHRAAAKELAKNFIKSNETIREGLKKSATLKDED